MNELPAHIYYGTQGPISVLTISGTLRFDQCGPLEYFLKKYLPELEAGSGLTDFYLDLSSALLLDSTALGLLAQIAIQVQKISHKIPNLYCTNKDLQEILLSMSLDQLFNFVDQLPSVLPELIELAPVAENTEKQTLRALSAHKTLINLSEENEQEFKTVVDLLEDSLRRGR